MYYQMRHEGGTPSRFSEGVLVTGSGYVELAGYALEGKGRKEEGIRVFF